MTILPKHLMSEEDIKVQYITPAITSKWNVKKISMEAIATWRRDDAKDVIDAEIAE